jgi:hypothetical protein
MLCVHFVSLVLNVEDQAPTVYDTSGDIDINVIGDLARVERSGMDRGVKIVQLADCLGRFTNLHFVILPRQIDASDHARQSGSYNDRLGFSHGSILIPFNEFIANSSVSERRINLFYQ